MVDDDPHGLRNKSYAELLTWTGGWRAGTANHIAGQQELQRRAGQQPLRLSTIAIGIALLSLAVAVYAALK